MKDPNERRALLAIALSLAVFTLWSAFFGPKPEAPAEGTPPAEQTAGTPAVPAAGAPAAGAPAPAAGAVPPVEAPPVAEAPCVPQPTTISTASARIDVSNCDGAIAQVALPGWHEAAEVTPWWTWLWQLVSMQSPGAWHPFSSHGEPRTLLTEGGDFAMTGRGPLADAGGAWELVPTEGATTLRRLGPDGLLTTKTIAPTKDPDVFDVTVTFQSGTALNGPLWIGLADTFSDAKGAYDMSPRMAAVVDEDLEQVTSPTDVQTVQPLEGPVTWFGVEDRYFLSALAPADPAWGTLSWARLPDGRTGAFFVGPPTGLAANQPVTLKFTLYTGPKWAERLNQLGHGLEEAANLGFFGFFAKILMFFLTIFHSVLQNWGLAIIALTFMVRIAFYPLSAKAYRSAKMMQAVQPKLKAIQEKYADDKETQTRETMALFQKHGVNPLGGCLPLVLQMPVFFALYSGLLHAPDLFHAPFLYVHDLSSPDPFGVFPALMAVGMVLQQRMTPMQGMDPAQAQIMRWMPLVFALFMFGLPAGLSLYYALNTLLSIAQQWYNTHSYKPVELAD